MGKDSQMSIYARHYPCETCGQRYLHPISLKLHRKAHEGLTTCQLCGRTLSMVASLRAHLRTVHALSVEEVHRLVPTLPRMVRYSCDQCDRSYKYKESLYAHRKQHQGLTICTLCHKTFATVGQLNRHVRIKHTELVAAAAF
ncbi:gastrula zinc finger protein xFG20-1-like [Pollicipes pollicipes]|uniref:gastrula zinc finger protein xFG20-1-like n=1 Tax=Pollicipes pollicipes TaxID=41117 RepID=UPI001884A786|nr:gastrula zinc finger protein xFG20-1-like [Pollicipes pollicipes]